MNKPMLLLALDFIHYVININKKIIYQYLADDVAVEKNAVEKKGNF
jgi:hypothetical protein